MDRRRFPTPSREVQRYLRESEREGEMTRFRDVRCPICGYWVAKIPVTQTSILYVKCRKCKFEGYLSPAYFRAMRRRYGFRPLVRDGWTRRVID